MSHPAAPAHRADCCIVGAGPAGVLLALILSRLGVSVALLEAKGDFDRDFRGDAIFSWVLEILDEFETIAPVSAVRGNTDQNLSEARFPVYRFREIERVGFLLTHIVDDPTDPPTELRRHLDTRPTRVVIYGHTHQHRMTESEGVLFLNPGSAGPKRFRLRRTACLLHLSDEGPRPTFYDLELRTPIETERESR